MLTSATAVTVTAVDQRPVLDRISHPRSRQGDFGNAWFLYLLGDAALCLKGTVTVPHIAARPWHSRRMPEKRQRYVAVVGPAEANAATREEARAIGQGLASGGAAV